MKKRFYLLFISVLFFGFSYAQKATISGILTDLSYNNEPIPFVSVSVKGTSIGTLTDDNGKYSLEVNQGNHILVFSSMGYSKAEVSVSVKSGEKKTHNQGLESEDITIEAISIEGVKSREKESALLMEQQKAVEIKQNIGAQELSRKGVGDVATAVAKTTGVSKQEGSNQVYVRGLGDRYNSTTMNGLPLPSNDPENKNFDLNLFTTDIVEYISIDKVYSTKNYGDFGGANVDISSKKYKGDGMFEISVGSTVNSNAAQKAGSFYLTEGPSKFGFSSYDIPENARTSYNFENSLNPVKEVPYAGNLGLKAGKSFNIGQEGRLNLFATAGFSSGYEYRKGINQSVSAEGARIKSFHLAESYSYKTNTTGLLNANYAINSNNSINYNVLFVNSSDQTKESYYGYMVDKAEDDNGLMTWNPYTRNVLMINQLYGNHTINQKLDLNWGVGYNNTTGDMPDRTVNTLKFIEAQNGYMFVQNTITDNHRYFQSLTENEYAINLFGNYKLGVDESGEHKGKITLGYNGRMKERDFEAIQYNFRIRGPQLTTAVVDHNNLDAFFNRENFDNNWFAIEAFAGDTPQTYDGEQTIHAGIANVEYKLSDRLTTLIGLRFEKIEQTVNWRTQLRPEGGTNVLNKNEFLPSLVFKYELNEKQNLRLAASKTYTLPQFKERAPFIFERAYEIRIGNPYLYSSQNYNLDLKWEMFPESDELISFTVFGKYIQDPISEVTIASASNDISWVNGDIGYVYGAEVELRKNIFNLNQELTNKLSAGLNIAYMQTENRIDNDKILRDTRNTMSVNLTDPKSSFTGASDLLINADLSYNREWNTEAGITATLVYSYYSDRNYALGSFGAGNLVDKGMGTLDFIFKTNIDKNLRVDFAARNILNPEFRRVQENTNGDVPVLTFKKGAFFSIGLTYQL